MIKKITLKNFKCFADKVSIDMSRLTVLYGKNGRGKSSVIQSILLLSQSLRENGGVLDTLVINGKLVSLGSWIDIRNRYVSSDKPIEIEIETDIEDSLRLQYVASSDKPTIASLSDIWVGDEHYVNYGGFDEAIIVTNQQDKSKKKMILPQSDIKTYAFLKSLAYVSANRRGPTNFETRNDNIDPYDMDAKGDNIINILAIKDSDFQKRFTQELSLVLSGASVRVYPNPEAPDRIELYLDSVDDNVDGFRPTNVGFGYSYVLPIIYQTLSAPQGGVVIVENPEAHLYPGAQSRLVDFLVKYANRNQLQIVLETHSDHIINGLRLAVKNQLLSTSDTSILFFDREDDECGNPIIEPISIDFRGALSKQPRDFMDEWTKQMLELL